MVVSFLELEVALRCLTGRGHRRAKRARCTARLAGPCDVSCPPTCGDGLNRRKESIKLNQLGSHAQLQTNAADHSVTRGFLRSAAWHQ